MTYIAELAAQLDALEAALPQLMKKHPEEGDFWSAFAGQADVIEDAAGGYSEMVDARIDTMLAQSQDDLGLAVIRGPQVSQGDPKGFGQLRGGRGGQGSASPVRSG